MVVRAFVRIIVSLVGAVFPLLFLSGSYSPLGSYLPNLPNLLGNQSGLYNSLTSSFGTALPVGVLPFGAAGVSGLAVYMVLQRVLGVVHAATYSRPKIDPSQMMRSFQSQMPTMMNLQGGMPRNLPAGMTNSQYLILTRYSQGQRKPKDVAKHLSMDRKAVEDQTRVLQSSGYLTRDNKLTTKGLDTLA